MSDDAVKTVIALLMVVEGRASRVFMLRFSSTVCRVVGIRDRGAVRNGLPCHLIRVVIPEGGRIRVGVGCACQPVDDVIEIAPTPVSG